ncbi:MAG: MFS transporter [Pseudomonadota bacterium]
METAGTDKEKIPLKLLVAITACWYLAQMGYYAQAQLFGSVMERYGLDEAAVGLIMSKEVMVYALTALLLAGPVTRISRAKIALLGGALVFASNIVSGMSESYEVLRIARMVSGFGAGMIGAAGTASAASSINPQRVFAIVAVSWGLLAAGGAVIFPYFTEALGAMGGYFSLAGAVVLLLPLCFWLPPPPRDPEEEAAKAAAMNSLSPLERFTEKLGVRGAPNKEFAIVALIALFIYEVGQGGIQVFLEQMGLRTGMDAVEVGRVLGIAGFVGLAGGVIAAWLSNRYGNLRPALLGIATNAIVACALALGESAMAFALLYLAWNVCFYFVVPYIMGIMSEMDKKGRWAVATDAVWWFGAAPGPAIGGYLVAETGYTGLAILPLVVGAISIVLFSVTLGRFYARRNTQQDSPPVSEGVSS